jgi:hypothetical protein
MRGGGRVSRSGYSDSLDQWALIKWRGQVASSIRGKRGQQLLKDILAGLDALPVKRLIDGELEISGEVCALGAAAKHRGVKNIKEVIPDPHTLSGMLDVTHQLAAEVMYVNDEWGPHNETPEQRFTRVRAWVAAQIWDYEEVPDEVMLHG